MRTRSRSPPRLMRGFILSVWLLKPTMPSAGAGAAAQVPTQCVLPSIARSLVTVPPLRFPGRRAHGRDSPSSTGLPAHGATVVEAHDARRLEGEATDRVLEREELPLAHPLPQHVARLTSGAEVRVEVRAGIGLGRNGMTGLHVLRQFRVDLSRAGLHR